MDNEEYLRYGRQMIVPEVGLPGQIALKNTSVLVVGAGGLGCPAIAYMAGAGVGKLGIVDGDTVEISNLHRQILHKTPGTPKAESAAQYVRALNPHVEVETYNFRLDPDNAEGIVSHYDLVLDCTDAPAIRYLINDACVLYNKPLVSAAALKTEGQLAVYHASPDSPCYRCMFPIPPPPELVGSCGDAGIVGPIVGLMGVYQAAEALRLIVSTAAISSTNNNNKDTNESNGPPRPHSLSIFSLFAFPQWRQMRVRGRRSECKVCGDDPSIKSLHDTDYIEFCGTNSPPESLGQRIDVTELKKSLNSSLIIDVRPKTQYEICALPNSINVPISDVRKMKSLSDCPNLKEGSDVITVCRYGNDSREAANKFITWGLNASDLRGGLNAWSDVDPSFPRY